MRDIVKEQINHYLHQFYYFKNSDVLLSELKKLAIKKDDEYKLDIFFIERILEERGLAKEVDQIYKDIASYKKIYKIDLPEMLRGYKSIFLKENIRLSIFSFGGSVFFVSLVYLIPRNWNILNGIVFILAVMPVLFSIWILSEPLLSCLIIPLIHSLLTVPLLILEGLTELTNFMTGAIKKLSLFHDKEIDKPIIEKIGQLNSSDIRLIETVFEKEELTEQQARIYLNSLLSVRKHISSNLL